MVSAEVTTVRVVAEDTPFGGGFGVKAFKHGNQRHCRAKHQVFDQAIDDVGVPVHGILHL